MSVRLSYDPIFLEHQTGRHPECPERLVGTVGHLQKIGWWGAHEVLSPRDATEDEIADVHLPIYVDYVKRMCEEGGGRLDMDTVASERSFDAACAAVGALLDAVDAVVRSPDSTTFCLVRPPGHHACPGRSMGFCLFNNVAVAARYARKKHGMDRVAILDWDVHHGNGTQDVFYEDPTVLYVSLHRFPFYPGSGWSDERGEGPGEGFTVNFPLPRSVGRKDYLEVFRNAALPKLREFQPDLTLISAGFDTYAGDPVGDGGFGLLPEDYNSMTRWVRDTVGDRVLSALEGGYDIESLPSCIEQHLRGLDNGGA